MTKLLLLALLVGLSMAPARARRAGFFVDRTAELDRAETTVLFGGGYTCLAVETPSDIVFRYVTITVQVKQRVRGRTIAASGTTAPLLELACTGDPQTWRVAARAPAPLREGLATVQAVARLYGVVWGLPCFGAHHTRLLAQARSQRRVELSHRLLPVVRRLNAAPRLPALRPQVRPAACFL